MMSSGRISSNILVHILCIIPSLYQLRYRIALMNFLKYIVREIKQARMRVFVPRPFGVFPMLAINFNTISDFHWDEHDEPNSLCCLVALGDFEGSELCFPQLQIIVPLRPGQVVAFSSRLLLHGNFLVTRVPP